MSSRPDEAEYTGGEAAAGSGQPEQRSSARRASGASSAPRVIVVGGGLVGLSCAYYLACEGARVVLLERDRLGAGASFGNAGTVAAGHPPLNAPGRVRKALGQMLDARSPLYIQPRWDPGLWRWLLEFARSCTREHVEASMRVLGPLGHDALALFDRLIEEEAIGCEYRRDGYYDVCTTFQGLREARHEAAIIRDQGYRPEVLDSHELHRREPVFGHAVRGGVFYPEARTLHPLRFLEGLAAAARARGTEIREGVDVVAVLQSGGRAGGVGLRSGDVEHADAVVLATGPYSLELAGRLGARLPVQPGKGYHRDVLMRPGGAPRLRIACVLHESSVFCTPMDRIVRFAGTMEFSGMNHVLHQARLEQLTHAARHGLPDLGHVKPVSEWCGLRPMAADGLPIVGRIPGVDGAWVATGHGMLGLTLGPVTGSLIARDLLQAEPIVPELSPARFG